MFLVVGKVLDTSSYLTGFDLVWDIVWELLVFLGQGLDVLLFLCFSWSFGM